jgi:diacylglycerol kinase (ATP)
MTKEKGGVNAAVFIEFLKRLMIGYRNKIFLIVDRGPAPYGYKAPDHNMPLVTDYRRSHHSSDRDTIIETVARQEMRGWRVSMQRSLTVERLLRAIVNSWCGLCGAAQSEAAVREELVAIALAVPLAFVVAESQLTRFALIAVVLFILVVELLNTAIEKLADEVATAPHPGIRRVKDMGSAAVSIALLVAGSVWLAAIGERLAFW